MMLKPSTTKESSGTLYPSSPCTTGTVAHKKMKLVKEKVVRVRGACLREKENRNKTLPCSQALIECLLYT